MPYVLRDQDGQVVAVSEVPLTDEAEEVAPDDPEVLALLARTSDTELSDDEAFVHSDLGFIRVLEDLIEVLLRKGVISLADLPGPAQDKMMQRRALRHWLAGVAGLVDGDDGNVI